MSHVIGVDIGGTFTDCVVVSDDGQLTIGKVPSTPPTFHEGFLDSIGAAARARGEALEEIVAGASGIYHGSTIAINALVESRVAKCGLLTTRGHRDTLASMQAGKRLQGMPPEVIARVSQQFKPAPLVPKELIGEIDERVAFDAAVIVELNEQTAIEAIDALVEQGVEAIAVSLLWSVRNPAHELRLRRLIEERAPGVFVSLSSEVIARTGEYERTVATVLNAMVGPLMGDYLTRLESELKALGYTERLQIMSCSGGLIDAQEARDLSIMTLGSGPVAGLVGSAMLGRHLDLSANGDGPRRNLIATDMGGTTFDVGIARDGVPSVRSLSFFDQFAYSIPSIDMRSVGSGGGSIVRYDENTGTLRVGPQSAGAVPGPACYRRGGTQATVTDADLVLGYLSPERFAGGALPLDLGAARRALEEAGRPLGMSAEEAAAAAVRIVDNQMADAIRLATIQQGIDPRGFEIYAYGGAGPVHAAGYGSELGVRRIVVPFSDFASGWSAVGVAMADALVVRERALPLREPFDAGALNEAFAALEEEVSGRLVAGGIPRDRVRLTRHVDMRYTTQVNEIQIQAPGGEYEDAGVDELKRIFDEEYTRLYGEGSAYPQAGYAIAGVMVRGSARISDFTLGERPAPGNGSTDPIEVRDVIWYHEDAAAPRPTQVFDGLALATDQAVDGPAVVELPDTTLLIREGQRATLDSYGSLVLTL